MSRLDKYFINKNSDTALDLEGRGVPISLKARGLSLNKAHFIFYISIYLRAKYVQFFFLFTRVVFKMLKKKRKNDKNQ